MCYGHRIEFKVTSVPHSPLLMGTNKKTVTDLACLNWISNRGTITRHIVTLFPHWVARHHMMEIVSWFLYDGGGMWGPSWLQGAIDLGPNSWRKNGKKYLNNRVVHYIKSMNYFCFRKDFLPKRILRRTV